MIEFILSVYKETFYKNKRAFIVGWIIFISTSGLTALLCSLLHINIKNIINGLDNAVPTYHDQFTAFVGMFLNNLKTCTQILFLGLIPILFLPWLSVIFNSALLGFVAYIIVDMHQNIFKVFLLGIFPHGILEYSVYILSACIATKFQVLWINKIKNLFRRKIHKQSLESLSEIIKQMVLQFFFILIPWILIAALIEAFVSKYLLDVFM